MRIQGAIEVDVVYVDGNLIAAKDALKERPELGLASSGGDIQRRSGSLAGTTRRLTSKALS